MVFIPAPESLRHHILPCGGPPLGVQGELFDFLTQVEFVRGHDSGSLIFKASELSSISARLSSKRSRGFWPKVRNRTGVKTVSSAVALSRPPKIETEPVCKIPRLA